jgi:serine/threonine-protein kinase
VLTSAGGTVLAECLAAGTYLVSWSPTQGYETSDVTRGPAATARVVFESDAKSVTMTLTCPDGPGGRPVASSSSGSWGGGHDE